MTFLRTKRPWIAAPNSHYAYNIPLKNVTATEDGWIGDIDSKDAFYLPNKFNIWPKGVLFPKYAWEKVG